MTEVVQIPAETPVITIIKEPEVTEVIQPGSSHRGSPPHLGLAEGSPQEQAHTSSSSASTSSASQSERIKRLLAGLEYLDSLYLCPIRKKAEIPKPVLKEIKGRPVRRYEIKDYYGTTQYYAIEMTNRFCYYLCSNSRSFQINMYTPGGHLVMECVRENSCALCCCGTDCCLSGNIITTANFRNKEDYIGGVVSNCSCTKLVYTVENKFYDESYTIHGPNRSYWCPYKLCFVDEFIIAKPQTGISVGKIIFGYDGLTEDLVPNKETVGVIFPPRCTTEIKACLVAAAFMMDVTYFHRRGCTLHRYLRIFLYFLLIAGFGAGFYFFAAYRNRIF